jgi:thioester reductase-like protein
MSSGPDFLARLQADAELGDGLRFDAPPADGRPAKLFLTGATGFLGAYLLDEWLRRTGMTAYCLVRAADAGAAQAKLRAHLEQCGLWDDRQAARVVAVAGDLAQPRLGLGKAEYARLAEEIDVVCHNGAWINAVLSYQDLKPVNVEGTRAILRFAGEARRKPLHYVSTLALFFGAAHANQPLAETDAPILDAGLRGGYKQSKWVAEQLVRNASARGLATAIYRPGRILGHSLSGVNANLQDIFCAILKACLRIGSYPEADTAIDITPVDYVSRAMVHLAQEEPCAGRAFHLRNPAPVAWNDLMGMIGGLGYPLRPLPHAEWRAEVERRSTAQAGEPFFRQLRLLLRSPIYLLSPDKPLYCGEATSARLAEAGIVCPRVDSGLLAVYLRYLRECGFLG